MATSKTGSTLAALNAQIAKLQAQAEALHAQEVAGVVARIRDAIEHYGLTAADLGFGASKNKAQKSIAKGAARPKTQSSAKKPVGTVKYTDGQGKTWSGVGKRPNWFKDAISAGKKPEDLLAKPEA